MQKTIVKEDVLLPEHNAGKAPTDRHENLWFKPERWGPATERFDDDCFNALIAKGIGDKRETPTIGRHVAFCVAAGIVAALTEKRLTLPVDTSWKEWENEKYIWEMLWTAVEAHKESADISFCASMLRGFLPRENYCPPFPIYYRSRFVERWENVVYPLTRLSSVHRLRPECIALGEKALCRLPEPVVAVIDITAQHIPPMLDLIIERIKKTYLW